jgi:DNA-directed RNA polymerase specialized sigma24 family protein
MLETQRDYPAMTFRHWLGAVVRNVCIDTLRALPEYQRRRLAGERRLVPVELTSLEEADGPASPDDIERRVDMQRMMAFLLSEEFPEQQRRAIAMWLDGSTNGEIADELGLTGPAESIRLLNAARQRMRRRFPRGIAAGEK